MFWQKDGEDQIEDVDLSDMLPNQDGSFQRRTTLRVSPEDLQKHEYTCVIKHSSLKKDLVLKARERRILRVPDGGLVERLDEVLDGGLSEKSDGGSDGGSETHSLQYFYTEVTGINFPEFTSVGLVDGEHFLYYDSNIRKAIPTTEWIKKVIAAYPDYLNSETQISQSNQENFKVNVATAMQRFNQTKGVHTMQKMYGCELDADGTTRGYMQYGYDGADFISFDLKTLTWTAANAKAVITKHKWDPDVSYTTRYKNYLENTCIDWLKKYVSYGRETLERKVPPEALMFQKFSSSPELVCHATGFFPRGVIMFWQKDGEDQIENVELRETLPNQDGSFQKRTTLKVSLEDLQKHEYTCVIKHSSLKDLVLKARERRILRVPDEGSVERLVAVLDGGLNEKSGEVPIGIIVGAVVGVLALVGIAAGILVWRKKKSGFRPVPSKAGSDGDPGTGSSAS